MMKALRKDKKSTKQARNLKRKEQHDLANEGAINYIFAWYLFLIFNILVAALAPPNLPSIDNILPQFKIGDYVYTIPDSSPGVDHTQAEAFYGSVFTVFNYAKFSLLELS